MRKQLIIGIQVLAFGLLMSCSCMHCKKAAPAPAMNAPAPAAGAVDPTGTWKWTMSGRNGQSREVTLKLKLEGGQLTGSVTGRAGAETPIEDATLSGSDMAFSVTRSGRNGQKSVSKFTGTLSGDTIKGKIATNSRTRDWEAKRAQ